MYRYKIQQESRNSGHVCLDNEFPSFQLTHSQIRYTVLYMALSTYSSASEIFVLSCCVTTSCGISGKAQYIRPWFSNTTTGHKLFFSVTLTSNAGYRAGLLHLSLDSTYDPGEIKFVND